MKDDVKRVKINSVGMYHPSPLTELPLKVTEAAEGGGDELSILGLYVLQDVLPVQADGIRCEKLAVQIC